MPLSLGEILDATVDCGLVDRQTAEHVRDTFKKEPGDPVRTLSLHARIPSTAVFQALAAAKGVDFIGRDQYPKERDLLHRVPPALVRRRLVLPVREDRQCVLVAVGDPDGLTDSRLKETLHSIFGKPVQYALADATDLQQYLEQAVESGPSADVDRVIVDDAIDFVEEILREAFIRRASDIHLEPEENGFRVRLRIDGELHVWRERIVSARALAALSRLKVLAQMDIAESRQPQDGSLVYELRGTEYRKFDIRMATAPTKYGERATLRLLGTDTKDLTLADLGFSPRMFEQFRELIQRPSGLILLTGPTGSGKTTTLYAALREINRPELNILTVEDPVEYSITGVSQLEIDNAGKVTFSSVLRSLLRHDPDVLMVGEIRDKETADIALRAAMTGHLVFSTLHTSTAVGAVTRLLDMKCDAYMIAATLAAAVSQRLVRRLCPACRAPRGASAEEAKFLSLGDSGLQVHEAHGCLRCQNLGFAGRIAICEMFCVDNAAREAISSGATERMVAKSTSQLITLREDAVQKVLDGLTTVNEIRNAVLLEEQ